MADLTPDQIPQLTAQMNADPRVQQAYAAYQKNQSQPNFNAYLEAVKPYLAQVDQSKWGINPATGEIQGTSNYGHPWKIAIGMAAGAAGAYGPWAQAGAGGANKAVDQATQYGDTETPGTVNVTDDGSGNMGGMTAGDPSIDWSKVLSGATNGGVDWVKLIAGLGASIPALVAAKQSPQQTALSGQQNELLKLQTDRMRQQDPLFQSTLRGYQAMLPMFAKGGP